MMIDRGYNGNANLKKKGQVIEWTQDKIQEFVKCAKDPSYFAEKYINIVHVDRGLIPISLYDYQRDIIDKITNNRRCAVVTSRQAGKTTTAVCVILHYVLFNEHRTVALLANKGDAAREILDRVKIAYEALPKWLQQGVVEWNKGSVEFENGCKILASATSSSAIRGKSISFLYIDETAFVENWDEFFASVFPTISSGNTTKILLTSTPNGLNHFYKTCEGAREGTNGYEFVQVMWQDVPGRDDAWKQETLSSMDYDYEKFSQEFECQFLGSSGTLIEGNKLKALVHKRPIRESNGLFMYQEPQEGHSYITVVDVSRGKGLDYSAFQILDVSKMPYRQVCAFRDNQVSDLLHYDFEYENILYTESAGRSGKRISSGFGKNVDKGVRTTKTVKAIGCSILKLLIEQDQLILNDFATIQELSTFSKKAGSFQAESGCHDDLVMCLVLFAWISDQQYFKEMTDIHTLKELRSRNEEEIMQELLPFGFYDDGMPDENVIEIPYENYNGGFYNPDLSNFEKF
jgi:hypothetical protein